MSLKKGKPLSEELQRLLRQLRAGLLRLHKALLDSERAAYERVHGQVNAGELLQLAINHEQFAWLRPVSELIVSIDEMLDAEEATKEEADALVSQAGSLLKPSETGSEFERRYYAAIQREPEVVLAHGDVMRTLSGEL